MAEKLKRKALLAENKKMLEAMREIDRYCNTVRNNYRVGSMEEQIASTVKTHIREFLHT